MPAAVVSNKAKLGCVAISLHLHTMHCVSCKLCASFCVMIVYEYE